MNITIDKIGSVTKNVPLSQELTITKNVIAQEGAVLVVKVMEDKKIYNQLELVSGRLSTLKKGDIIAVALGNRKALKGFVGEVPSALSVGDTIHILNVGGVAGICTSENVKEVGHALKAKVLGSACDEHGTPFNIKQFSVFSPKKKLHSNIPLIVVSGTCMNVGKTSVACEIIKYASRKFKVFSAKLTGVAALKDTENMKDYGAREAVTFIDAGCASTVNHGNNAAEAAKGAIDYLSEDTPDYIVIEFGDGVYGEYGVQKILGDKEIQRNIAAHVGCAHDPMGAAKLAEECKRIGAPIDIVSGPVTDNSVGVQFIADHLHLPAFNALYDGEKLFNHIMHTCLKK